MRGFHVTVRVLCPNKSFNNFPGPPEGS
jgi:hypothetical protein